MKITFMTIKTYFPIVVNINICIYNNTFLFKLYSIYTSW